MERLDRWARNVYGAKPPIPKPSYPQTIISQDSYTTKPPICQTFITYKTLYKMYENVQ